MERTQNHGGSHKTRDVGFWCETWVCDPDNLHPFIKRIEVVTSVVKLLAFDLLMYYFIVEVDPN